MKKKEYQTPKSETVDMLPQNMLSSSGGLKTNSNEERYMEMHDDTPASDLPSTVW